jgi:hypothetical protein
MFVFLFSLSACSNGLPRPHLPYRTWYVGLAAPRHMEVWVESVDVIDQRGYAYADVFGGVAGYTRKPEGWHKGGGKTMPVANVDLPLHIFLRWQSLVEPQTYMINIEIPQRVRDEMFRSERVHCKPVGENMTLYRDTINLGMAPGGIVKVWVGTGCLGYKEVGRFQEKIDFRGPYKGKSNGKYINIETEKKPM